MARLAANGKEPSEYKRNDEGEENRLNRIIKINKSFIELDGIERITGLAKYISELSAAVYEQ